MKLALTKKNITIAVIAVIAVIAIVLITVANNKAEQEAQHQAELEEIEDLVDDIFEFYKDGEEDSLSTRLQYILQRDWMEEEFIRQAVVQIHKYEFSSSYGSSYDCMVIKRMMLLLEYNLYECPEIKQAFTEMLTEQFGVQVERFGLEELAEDAMIHALDDEPLYNRDLTYYVSPQSVFLNTYLPVHMEEVWTAATAEKDTGAVINLLAGLSVVNETTELTGLVDVSALLDYLKTDAEEILIGEYEGYYGGKTGSIDSSYENDKIWDAYLPGDYVHSSFSSVDYYGDLASYFYSSGGVYRDEDGKVHGNTASESYSTYVELKGERISFESVENCIKYAHEEDMTNYHKDGYCFAIGDTTFVCYVGGEIVFQFATPDK